MSELFFNLKKWSTWAPGLSSLEDWRSWAEQPQPFLGLNAPKPEFIPSSLRRRSSQLTKMALETAYRVLSPDELSNARMIFSSRNGESRTTQVLLEALAAQEPLSPMAFSLSVHNSAAGIFSIAAANKNTSTALAAGLDSFCAGLVEAAGELNHEPHSPVCLITVDEYVAEAYRDVVEFADLPFSLALLFEHADQDSANLRLTYEPTPDRHADAPLLPQALSFVQWLLSKEENFVLRKGTEKWVFSKSALDWTEYYSEAGG